MAAPGSVYSATSAGCHELLRDGAHLVVSGEQVVQEVRGDPLFRLLKPTLKVLVPKAYGDLRDELVRVLSSRSLSLDQLCTRTGTTAREVATAMAQLRLDQVVVLRQGLYSVAHRRELLHGRGMTGPEAGL
jgi:DNA processing protein